MILDVIPFFAMNDKWYEFPRSCKIPETEFTIVVTGAAEFRMGVHTVVVRVVNDDHSVNFDLSDFQIWGFHPNEIFVQSKSDPSIIALSYKTNKGRTIDSETLILNLKTQMYRIAENSDSMNDQSNQFQPFELRTTKQ